MINVHCYRSKQKVDKINEDKLPFNKYNKLNIELIIYFNSFLNEYKDNY